MNGIKWSLIFGTVLMLAFGCKKSEQYSKVPTIKFVALTPNSAIKDSDQVKIMIECTDGDGDVGENVPDAKNLFVTDSRNNVTYAFRISQLAPNDAGIIIRANLNINLNPQGFVDDNNTTETATYSVYLKDRAGNSSNTITTPALVINAR